MDLNRASQLRRAIGYYIADEFYVPRVDLLEQGCERYSGEMRDWNVDITSDYGQDGKVKSGWSPMFGMAPERLTL